jgi:hypothetical protein
MNNSRKKYEIFGQMDSDKFMDFMIDFFDNMGMRETDLPLNCSYCPFKKKCNQLEDTEMTCLEFLLTKLK